MCWFRAGPTTSLSWTKASRPLSNTAASEWPWSRSDQTVTVHVHPCESVLFGRWHPILHPLRKLLVLLHTTNRHCTCIWLQMFLGNNSTKTWLYFFIINSWLCNLVINVYKVCQHPAGFPPISMVTNLLLVKSLAKFWVWCKIPIK